MWSVQIHVDVLVTVYIVYTALVGVLVSTNCACESVCVCVFNIIHHSCIFVNVLVNASKMCFEPKVWGRALSLG